MYWHQGFGRANEVVQQCVGSWKFHNPGWEIILLDQHSVTDYIDGIDVPDERLNHLRIQHRSDLIRTKLLIQYGGVWVDPTCFCTQPLDNWLFDNLEAGVFFFHKPGRDRLIGNWFIAAKEKNSPLLVALYERLCQYWSENDFRNFHRDIPWLENSLERFINRNPSLTRLWLTSFFTKVLRLYPYMIYHYVFNEVVVTDPVCKKLWDTMPKRSALEPPILQRLGLLHSLNDDAKRIIDQKKIPLFKLNWKVNTDRISEGTIVHYLFNSLR